MRQIGTCASPWLSRSASFCPIWGEAVSKSARLRDTFRISTRSNAMKHTLLRSIGLLSLLLLSNCGGGSEDGDSWRSFSASVRNFTYGRKSFILTNNNTVVIKSRWKEDDPNIIGPNGTASPLETGRNIPVLVYVGEESDVIASAQNNGGGLVVEASVTYTPTDDLGAGIIELHLPAWENEAWRKIVQVLTNVEAYWFNTDTRVYTYGSMSDCKINLAFHGEDEGTWGADATVTKPRGGTAGVATPSKITGMEFRILLAN